LVFFSHIRFTNLEIIKMSADDRLKATAKNVEGKIQEGIGNITGDPKDQAAGQAKQGEAKVRHTVEDAKEEVKKAID
ncbi:MAG TPA: CsbD family protein, partial [Candidatus Obscuribacterales bacterium]